SHPSGYSFGGIGLFHWFDTITDLINDAYADVESRKKRLAEIRQLNENLKSITANGALFNLGITRHLIYDVMVLFVENIDTNPEYVMCIFEVFELDQNDKKNSPETLPVTIISLGDFKFNFKGNVCEIGLF